MSVSTPTKGIHGCRNRKIETSKYSQKTVHENQWPAQRGMDTKR